LQVTQLFKDHGIQHAPRYLFNDVAQAIQHVHLSGKMHERCGMPCTQQLMARSSVLGFVQRRMC
jgi:hypothetical protein